MGSKASCQSTRYRYTAGCRFARYGRDWLNAFRSSVSGDLGQIQVMQKLTPQENSGIEVFSAGATPVKSARPVTRPINDYWFLTYTPSDHRPVVSLLDLSFPGLIAATLSALFILLFIQKRILQNHRHFQQFLERFSKKKFEKIQVSPAIT